MSSCLTHLSGSPLVIVIIGPGGVGKGTLARHLVARDARLVLSRSWTTRAARPSETDADYVFVDRSTFEQAITQDFFYEWADFHGNLYGTPRPAPSDDRDVVLEIEVQGAAQAKVHDPEAVVFLIEPPSSQVLEVRLRGRGDTDDHVARRLASAQDELAAGRQIADFVVVNDDVDRASEEILSILERLRQARRRTT